MTDIRQQSGGSFSSNHLMCKPIKLQIFPEKVAETEIAYYLARQNKNGLLLGNREAYIKTDWSMCTATLAKDKAALLRYWKRNLLNNTIIS